MHRSIVLLTASTMYVASAFVVAAESSVLRDKMGDEVYQRAGISELSAAQIDVLEAWVLAVTDDPDKDAVAPQEREVPDQELDGQEQVRVVTVVESSGTRSAGASQSGAQTEDEPVTQKYVLVDSLKGDQRKVREQTPDLVRSRIAGEFKGWRGGRTKFVLENGEVWKQRQTSTFVTKLDSPEVIIRKGRFGYRMEIPAIGKTVLVKRIR